MLSAEEDRYIYLGYRKLAVSVVYHAVNESMKKINRKTGGEIINQVRSARFSVSNPNPIMSFWCEVAGISDENLYAWGKRMQENDWKSEVNIRYKKAI